MKATSPFQDTIKKLEEQASGFALAVVKMRGATDELNSQSTSLLVELVRPSVPALEGVVELMTGATRIAGWAAARLVALATSVGSLAVTCKAANDERGEPTIGEILVALAPGARPSPPRSKTR